uniref:Uncharacterized protein n=1 Tax=Aegilops tauschii subsp. strangulata TaxID=200361 RepID=A0A453B4A4_AEGTS
MTTKRSKDILIGSVKHKANGKLLRHTSNLSLQIFLQNCYMVLNERNQFRKNFGGIKTRIIRHLIYSRNSKRNRR